MFALIVENVRNALQQLFLYLKRLGEVKKFKSTINANIAYKNTDSTVICHLGRDSHYAILHNALWVNANLFQTDLCRDPESKDGMIVQPSIC